MKTKVKDLPAKARMENTGSTAAGSYLVKIVDGVDTGTTGEPGFLERSRIGDHPAGEPFRWPFAR